jgi:hypothetical protein
VKDRILAWLEEEKMEFGEGSDHPDSDFNIQVGIEGLTTHILGHGTSVHVLCRIVGLKLNDAAKRDLDNLFALSPMKHEFLDRGFQVVRVVYQESLDKQTLMDWLTIVTKSAGFGARQVEQRKGR